MVWSGGHFALCPPIRRITIGAPRLYRCVALAALMSTHSATSLFVLRLPLLNRRRIYHSSTRTPQDEDISSRCPQGVEWYLGCMDDRFAHPLLILPSTWPMFESATHWPCLRRTTMARTSSGGYAMAVQIRRNGRHAKPKGDRNQSG